MNNNDWKEYTLSDLCKEVRYGYTASASEKDIGPKFLRITDIVPDQLKWDDVPYCEISEDEFEKFELSKGDILVARTGATTGYAKQIKNPPKAVFASYLVRLKIKDEFNEEFVGHIVQSKLYKEFIKKNWGGSAQPNANAQIITSYPLKVPGLKTQQKIASILSAFDDLIENNTRRIEILEEMARLIYREWFVHYRYPGHENDKLIDSGTDLGEIPEGWEVKKLEDVIDLAYGKGLRKKDRIEGPYPVYGSSGIIDWHNDYHKEGPGIIVGRKGNVGSVFWAYQNFNPIDTTYYVETDIPLTYVYYNLLNQNFINNDAAVPGLSKRQANSLPVLIPHEVMLKKFDKQIIQKFDFKRVLERKTKKLKETRDLLLPKLVSGNLAL